MTRSKNSRRGKYYRNSSPAPKRIGNSCKYANSWCAPALSRRLSVKRDLIRNTVHDTKTIISEKKNSV
jgi:hypothetical protein